MDMEKLAAEAAVAAVKEIVKTGVSGGAAAGGKLWAWVKSKAGKSETATVEKIEAAPDKPSAEDNLRGLLKDILHDKPELQKELKTLLAEMGASGGISQTNTAKGDGNKQVNISGSGNSVDFG